MSSQNSGRSSADAPTLCMVYDAIADGRGSIPQIALGYVKLALDAGWRVTCVTGDLDDSVQGQVEWLPLYIPPKGFLIQWLSARRNIRAAIGDRKFDVLHAHQAQIAALGDVMQCHFLTRVALERNCLESRNGLKNKFRRAQQMAVVQAEDRYFGGWNPRTRMLFNSELTRQEFARLYGMPPCEEVFLCDVPPIRFPDEAARAAARRELVGEGARQLVIGYLGGRDKRKGYERLIPALREDDELLLLVGGPGSEGWRVPELGGRFKSLGMVKDLAGFYAACDVVIVPSLFEPFGLVATEAAAAGVPVIATPEVGALPHLLEYGAGAAWQPGQPLGDLARDLAARRAEFNRGATRMAKAYSSAQQGARLLQIYDEIRARKRA